MSRSRSVSRSREHPARRVAHVTTIDMSLRRLLLDQLRYLKDAGYDVVGVSSPGPDVPAIEAAGIRHVAVPMTRSARTPFRDLVALWRLYRLFGRERFTIVHTHTPKPGFIGQLAARLAGVPVIVNTIHGYYFYDPLSPLARRFFVGLERMAARWSDAILFQSREDVDTAIREEICPPERIRHLGNGIDLERFDPEAMDRERVEAARRDVGLPRGVPVVGFVGRLVREKGLMEMFEAAARVRVEVPDAHFLVIGPVDRDKPDAVDPSIARGFGIAEAIRFPGFREDMPEMYALMDVLALPSHREGFPRTPMEASAMGVPSVVTDIRGCREAVEDARNGMLVPPRDSEALAGALVDLLHDEGKRRRMAEEARAVARERFDERVVFRVVAEEYARLLAEKGIEAVKGSTGSRRPATSQPASAASDAESGRGDRAERSSALPGSRR